MKKMELLHTHALLVEVRNYLEEKNGVTITAEEYEELDATPTGIHLQKGDHEDAVVALTDALSDFAEEPTTERAAPEVIAD